MPLSLVLLRRSIRSEIAHRQPPNCIVHPGMMKLKQHLDAGLHSYQPRCWPAAHTRWPMEIRAIEGLTDRWFSHHVYVVLPHS